MHQDAEEAKGRSQVPEGVMQESKRQWDLKPLPTLYTSVSLPSYTEERT